MKQLSLLATLLLLPSLLLAQNGSADKHYSTIEGSVVEVLTQMPLVNATIEVISNDRLEGTTHTDSSGQFSIELDPDKNYSLSAYLPGFYKERIILSTKGDHPDQLHQLEFQLTSSMHATWCPIFYFPPNSAIPLDLGGWSGNYKDELQFLQQVLTANPDLHVSVYGLQGELEVQGIDSLRARFVYDHVLSFVEDDSRVRYNFEAYPIWETDSTDVQEVLFLHEREQSISRKYWRRCAGIVVDLTFDDN